MGIRIVKREYAGWPNCLELSNGALELVVTTDVGPRVIHLGLPGGPNEFAVKADQAGKTRQKEWCIFGGHRFWHSPEYLNRTYYPDSEPVQYRELDTGVILTQNVETNTQVRKELEITLDPDAPRVTVVHRMTNMGVWEIELAPWALSVMDVGGVAIVPQPTKAHPEGLLPNRTLTLWPYTNMQDPRVLWGEKYILLKQDPAVTDPFKLGISANDGWTAYANNNHLFVKLFDYYEGEPYPDGGSSVEMYTCDWMLELETLGSLTLLAPDETVEYVEEWILLDGVAKPETEADVEEQIVPLVAKLQEE
ncbi:MAG TPA: hypothetical protein GXX57_09505 [Firmicutes bacterium]|nr:hypothetical protein [Bacillota bacterium]